MPHSYGYRARTRDMFSRDFRTQGHLKTSTYLTNYKRGDYVDIKVNPMIHRGMPFKHYHGRTGIVYNVTPRALGVMVNKEVNGKIIVKRINVRVEHVRKSKCQQEIKARSRTNEAIKKKLRGQDLDESETALFEGLPEETKADVAAGKKVSLSRKPNQPKAGYFVKLDEDITTIQPAVFSDLV